MATDAPDEPDGHGTASQEPEYKFALTVAVTATTEPEKPRLQRQPLLKLVPLLNVGHGTVLQAPMKYGLLLVAVIVPLYPAIQEHFPAVTTSLFTGQLDCTQLPVKYGAPIFLVIAPEYPALQKQPASTLVPLLFEGQPTCWQDP